MEKEPELKDKENKFLENLEHRLDLLDPNLGSFVRIYVKEKLNERARKLLEDNHFTIVYALTAEELKSEKVQKIVLSSQYISYQNKAGKFKSYLPFRVALTTKEALKEAMADIGFADTWREELRYGWLIEE